jgi:cyanophycin synthetase
MEQLVVFGKYTDNYRALIGEKYIYFNSIPVKTEQVISKNNWDDKFFLKEELAKTGIPVPHHKIVPFFKGDWKDFFELFPKPMIIKPRSGSRGRHTTTGIRTYEEFEKAVLCARILTPQVVAEEEIIGYVCRATCVDGQLVGFYRAGAPIISGDGKHTIQELIEEKNKNRPERISEIIISQELIENIKRAGYEVADVLPWGENLKLTYRTGRYYGGETREMLDELSADFVPYFEKAAKMIDLSVLGFDCIVENPEKSEEKQRWGIIECNTLPFIDLHYFALEGKPRNIAGMIWDFWIK